MSKKAEHELEVRYRHNTRLCNAKGNTCKAFARKHNQKCRNHGGDSVSGIACGTFKHGRNSKYLSAIPERLKSDFKAMQEREDWLSLGNEVVLADALIFQALANLDKGESGELWIKCKAAFDDFRKANRQSDTDGAKLALYELSSLIERGVSDYYARKEAMALVEQRRKLVDTESKRQHQQQELIATKEVLVLINALLSVINEHVTERDTRTRIQAEFLRITTADNRNGLRVAG